MSRARALAKGLSVAGAVTVGVAGVAYGLERLAVARIRRSPDPHPDSVLAPIDLPSLTIPSFDGGTINYVDSGPGIEPVTLLFSHGVTLSVRTWVQQLRTLPEMGFRTIAFDHRGHGGSRLGGGGFAVEHLAHDLDAVLTELDLHNVVIVGHSMGGIGAQAFLAEFPAVAAARVAGVVLLSTLPSAFAGSQAARLGQFVERTTRRTPDSTRIWGNANAGLLLARFGFGRDPVASHVELVRQMMHECPPTTRVQAPRSIIGFDYVADLEHIAVPTLIIGGTADVITPPRESMRMHEAIPNSRLEMFDGGGHMLMLERASAVNRLITEFAHEVGRDD